MAGPLAGYRIIEIAGIGPGPFCAMLLADMGADVVRVDRAERASGDSSAPPPVLRRDGAGPPLDRGRPQEPRRRRDGAQARRDRGRAHRGLPARRHGAARHRARAVPRPQPEARVRPHDRMGPGRSATRPGAGHDINYIALAGCLAHIGSADGPPVPPLNLVGDFGGGGMFLAFGVVCALLDAQKSGKGQVVDAAMVDGAAVLMSMFHGVPRDRHVDQRARLEPARHRLALLRRLRVLRRRVRVDRLDRAAVLRRAPAHHGPVGRSRVREADGPFRVAGAEAALARGVPHEDARRVVRADGAHRRVLRAGAHDRRGSRAPAQRGPQDVRRGRRHLAAVAGAPLLPHAGRALAPSVERGTALRRRARPTG